MSRIDINQLEFIHKRLRGLHSWLETRTGLTFTITSLYRMKDGGVHGQIPVRGMDLRMRNKDIGESIVRYVNDNWAYDTERPNLECAILHGQGANMHIHLQVHERTIKITN